ncbi:MAG TPA: HNH endonuclease [Allosphingosinicella sp.]|jgi:hypothetical protein
MPTDAKVQCAACGRTVARQQARREHIVPISQGGTIDESNIRIICNTCSLLKTAGALNIASNAAASLVQRWWRLIGDEQYRRFYSELASILVGGAGATVIFIMSVGQDQPKESQASSFEQQLASLDATQRSLNQLEQFVVQQREQMKVDRQALADLRQRRASLEPVVQADQRTVDALLRMQEERNRANAVRERWIGAGIGVGGSLVASALLALAALMLKRWALRKAKRAQED